MSHDRDRAIRLPRPRVAGDREWFPTLGAAGPVIPAPRSAPAAESTESSR